MLLTVPRLPVRAFAKNEDGTIALMFGLLAVPMLLCVGLAVDVNTAYHANARAAQALDAAAIGAAKMLRDGHSTPAEITALAQRIFNENVASPGGFARHSALNVVQDAREGRINVDVRLTVPANFARVAGFQEFTFRKSSEARYDQKDIEVAVQLDVTGSMQGAKLNALKVAANDLVNILLPAQGPRPASKVRIALAPFAAGVNAGPYADAVALTTAPGGCIYERDRAASETTDDAPNGLDKFRTRAQLPGATACPSSAIVTPLSENRTQLAAAINAFDAQGWTAGHLGSSWAWYLLSPKWAGVWPSSSRPANYQDKKTAKYAILMTDGQYNTYGGQPYNENLSEARARAICTGMKTDKIRVFTIGFQLGAGSSAERLLQQCASSAGSFYRADSAEALRAAFRTIAQEIGGLRLSQ